jgi:glycine/D-amino acid oxidase-like deaminating enzyme
VTPSYRQLSLWHDTCGDDLTPRRSLPGPAAYDVAIVGAGLTGLWSAYYLAEADPSLRVVVLEKEVAGFGASGRNGGWCSALFPTPWRALVEAGGEDGARRQLAAMRDTVDEVGRVCDEEGIDAGFHKGGTITLARTPVQLARLAADGPDERLLDAAQAREVMAADGVLGGHLTPHCARVHPARLVRGLARVVESRGVQIHERTEVTAIERGGVETTHGRVDAEVVLRCTEGYTARLPGLRRAVAPVYSLMVATEPLPAEVWERIGLADRSTFTDARHLIVYGQRTVDDRLAFGGRGAPYHLGSRVQPRFDREPRVFDALQDTLVELLPVLRGVTFTHAWGGPLGIARDWAASVGLDRATGLGWAGGYVGDGLATTNLAGRTLADLVTRRDTDLVTLPWVAHRSRRWEPEPARWLGINAGLRVMSLADGEERLTGRESVLARLMAPLVGGH